MEGKDFNAGSLCGQIRALTEGVPHLTANLANVSALLYCSVPDVSWAGFYLREGEKLVLGPFQGKPACIEIAPGRGVCGKAAESGEILTVPDVHAFPGHIACDSGSRSEAVAPVCGKNGEVLAVLDLDSYTPGRCFESDAEWLAMLAAEIARVFAQG